MDYPNNYRDSTDFAKVSDESINDTIKLILEEMKTKEENQHLLFRGDTMILVMRMHEEDGGGFEVIVTKDYKQAYFGNKIFK